jgi:hypothetical protein
MVTNQSNDWEFKCLSAVMPNGNIIYSKATNSGPNANLLEITNHVNNQISKQSETVGNPVILVSDAVKSSKEIIYDYGKQITENIPVINKDGIREIRAECINRLNKLEEKQKMLDEMDSEFYDIDDIIDLYKETLKICQDHKNQDVFDSESVYKISFSYYRASDSFKKLFLSKGWGL